MLRKTVLYSTVLLILVLSSATFAQTEKRIAYGVLIDNTGSLRSQFGYVVELGKGVVERIHERGPVSLFNFTSVKNGPAVVTAGTEWSQNKAALDNYIDSLFVEPGQTTLFDAINSMAEKINIKVNLEKDVFSDKVIVLITDGEDRVSKIKEKQLIEKLKESGIKVYALGLVQELVSEGVFRGPREKATDFLKKVAKETGGRAVFLESNKEDPNSVLNELFAEPGRK
jgi:uncharacterized protein YciU (UPF0263 family)